MRENDPESFFYKYFRMSPEQFHHLLSLTSLSLTNACVERVEPKHTAKLSQNAKSEYMIGRILQKTRWPLKFENCSTFP